MTSAKLRLFGLAAGVLGTAVVILIAPRFLRGRDTTRANPAPSQRHAWLANVPLPPPIDIATLNPRYRPPRVSSETQTVSRSRPMLHEISYDPNLSLLENLKRLKGYCASDPHRPTMTFRTVAFAGELARHAAREPTLVREALDDTAAPSFFRVLMLQCLVKIKGPGYEDAVWRYAVDSSQGELSTAGARFLRDLDASARRPDDYLRVLDGAEGDRAIFALQAARLQMNERVLAKIEELATTHSDLNVRVAAVHAAGDAGAMAQPYLLSLAETLDAEGTTSSGDADLVRRVAVWRLDPSWPATASVTRKLAADPAESPGIRRKALVKFAETYAASAEPFIINLMNRLPDDQAVVLTGCAEALMHIGTPTARRALAQRCAVLTDESLKGALDHVLNPSDIEAN